MLTFFNLSRASWCFFAVTAATAIVLPAQTFTTLYSFDGTEGNPRAGLVQARDGNLYGALDGIPYTADGGTIFKTSLDGNVTTVYSFCAQSPCQDGGGPYGAPIQATDGNFYGTTEGLYGPGSVFKVTPSGAFTMLYGFCSQECNDGEYPEAGLVQATNGYFYGTTNGGGSGDDNSGGTVFQITGGGILTTLHSFCSSGGSACLDGAFPQAALIQSRNGNLYGTTFAGGAYSLGTVFEITLSGTLTTLYSFCAQTGCPDGELAGSALVEASNGLLYGTTVRGGAFGSGTIFEITPAGDFKTLYSFCSQSECWDGGFPVSGLIQANDGNLYGTTTGGGATASGTLFKITLGGVLTTLYNFCSLSGCEDGINVESPLIQATTGELYGTTLFGGSYNSGTLFSLSTDLSPFVALQTTSGKAGSPVYILGTGLTGASSVSFGGTKALFEVLSSSSIVARVPVRARTGTVEVVTPGGTLLSNQPFRRE